MKNIRLLMQKFLKDEKGAIAVLFTGFIVIAMVLLGITVDAGRMYIQRAHLLEIGHIIRDARFNETIYINNSETPAVVFNNIARTYAVMNGLDASKVSTAYRQTELTNTRRAYEVDIFLNDTYQCTFLKLAGLDEEEINVTIRGSAWLENSNRVWAPGR